MKWKELSGKERYQVVELARRGQTPITEICKKFGVSRQTLYQAMEKADQAGVMALERKERGRKGKTAQELELEQVQDEKTRLQKELQEWKTKFEIAKAFIDLQRNLDKGEPLPGEKGHRGKKRRRRKR